MDSKANDTPPTHGLVKPPDAVRPQSPMRFSPAPQPGNDLEAQSQPGVTSVTRTKKLSWRDAHPKRWREQIEPRVQKLLHGLVYIMTEFMHTFCPCCLGPYPRLRGAAYILFPCCTGSYNRRKQNLGMCMGFLFAAVLTTVVVGFLSILIYLILKACGKL